MLITLIEFKGIWAEYGSAIYAFNNDYEIQIDNIEVLECKGNHGAVTFDTTIAALSSSSFYSNLDFENTIMFSASQITASFINIHDNSSKTGALYIDGKSQI